MGYNTLFDDHIISLDQAHETTSNEFVYHIVCLTLDSFANIDINDKTNSHSLVWSEIDKSMKMLVIQLENYRHSIISPFSISVILII